MIDILALAVFAGLLLYAACSDVVTLTIPNWVSLALIAAFPPAALAVGEPLGEIGLHFFFGFCVLAVGFFLFHGNIIGGGDAKLLAAVSVWTGVAAAPTFLLSTALCGGALAAAALIARRFVPPVLVGPEFLQRLLEPKGGVPYGVAIMAGGLLSLDELPFVFGSLTTP